MTPAVDVSVCGASTGGVGAAKRRGRSDGGPVIDIHCHLGVPAAAALVDSKYHFSMPPNPTMSDQVNAEMMRTVGARLNGLDERLRDMDELGIDIQVMSPNPGQYYYAAPIEEGRKAAAAINDAIAAAVARVPERFRGLGTVPLQDVQSAIKEMRRCRSELGMRGIEVGTNVAGRDFDDPSFAPFFAAVEELDLLLFMHPMGFTEPGRLRQYHLANVIGNPLDTTVAVSHLIFGGVLDRHPGLKICIAHGGGYLPAYSGRMDHAFAARADCRTSIAKPPSEYLSRLYFDTLVFDPCQLDALVRRWGADHLCLGSDYPFDMAEPDPLGFHHRLEPSVHDRIVGGNAERLLGLATVRNAS